MYAGDCEQDNSGGAELTDHRQECKTAAHDFLSRMLETPGTDPKHEALSLRHLARLVSPQGHSSGRACFAGFDSSEFPHNNR